MIQQCVKHGLQTTCVNEFNPLSVKPEKYVKMLFKQ